MDQHMHPQSAQVAQAEASTRVCSTVEAVFARRKQIGLRDRRCLSHAPWASQARRPAVICMPNVNSHLTSFPLMSTSAVEPIEVCFMVVSCSTTRQHWRTQSVLRATQYNNSEHGRVSGADTLYSNRRPTMDSNICIHIILGSVPAAPRLYLGFSIRFQWSGCCAC